MKLTQYVYGRLPARQGFDTIARTPELYFLDKRWMQMARYGGAPTRETPERIWSLIYEVQRMEEGMLLSCLYPLKQTQVPCREMQPPYPRGISAAAHHLQVRTEDIGELMEHPEQTVFYDDFFDIDAVYPLAGKRLSPVEYTQQNVSIAPAVPWEKEMLCQLVPAVWQGFVSRMATPGVFGRAERVYLVAKADEPDTELASLRRMAALVLRQLPSAVRELASVTLNVELETDEFPPQSVLYGCYRSDPATVPAEGLLFDMGTQRWPDAQKALSAFIADRIDGKNQEIASALALAPGKASTDLALHARAHALERVLAERNWDIDALEEAWQALSCLATAEERSYLGDVYARLFLEKIGNVVLSRAQMEHLWRVTVPVERMSVQTERMGLTVLRACPVDMLVMLVFHLDEAARALPGQSRLFARALEIALASGEQLGDRILMQLGGRIAQADFAAGEDQVLAGILLTLAAIMKDKMPHRAGYVQQFLQAAVALGGLSCPLPGGIEDVLIQMDTYPLALLLETILQHYERAGEYPAALTLLEESILRVLVKRKESLSSDRDFHARAIARMESLASSRALWAKLLLSPKDGEVSMDGEQLLRLLRVKNILHNDELKEVLEPAVKRARAYAAAKIAGDLRSEVDLLAMQDTWAGLIQLEMDQQAALTLCDASRRLVDGLDAPALATAWEGRETLPRPVRKETEIAMAHRAMVLSDRSLLSEDLWVQSQLLEAIQSLPQAEMMHGGMLFALQGMRWLDAMGRWMVKKKLHPVLPDSFLALRRQYKEMPANERAGLYEGIAKLEPGYEVCLLQACGAAGIDWDAFFANALPFSGVGRKDLAAFARWKQEDRLSLLSLLCRLYAEPETGVSVGHWLIDDEEQAALMAFLRSDYPGVVAWLRRGRMWAGAMPGGLAVAMTTV